MKRITQKDLERLVMDINTETGMPHAPYTRTAERKIVPSPGCYHLDYAYGGVKLVRMSMEQGCTGISNVSTGGYGTKRELYTWMRAFLEGLTYNKGE